MRCSCVRWLLTQHLECLHHRFGAPLEFSRGTPSYLQGPQWHALSYLDPAMLWLPTATKHLGLRGAAPTSRSQQLPPTVKATIVREAAGGGGSNQQEQQPPPAAVTISKTETQSVEGVRLQQIAGVAVREYGAVVPYGLDGSYMVYERMDRADARKRLAAAGGTVCSGLCQATIGFIAVAY